MSADRFLLDLMAVFLNKLVDNYIKDISDTQVLVFHICFFAE
jgi:hypothetical protein